MRKILLVNNELYHVFNRGVEKRTTFTNIREYHRALLTMDYYRFDRPPLALGQMLNLAREKRDLFLTQLKSGKKLVEIMCFCLMPNHFHFLLRQNEDNGIKTFVSNFTNSYTKYFNNKNDRVGPLFQGIFKSVRVEDDEQLMHVSRYIHLNPATNFLIDKENLENYPWSSLKKYTSTNSNTFCETSTILKLFISPEEYMAFVSDQLDYSKTLEQIKHLALE